MKEQIEFLIFLKAKGEKSESALKRLYVEKFGNAKDFATSMKEVNSLFSEYFRKTINDLAPEIAMHYWDLYAKSYKLQDYRECRSILKELRDLTSTYEEKNPAESKNKKTSVLELRKKPA